MRWKCFWPALVVVAGFALLSERHYGPSTPGWQKAAEFVGVFAGVGVLWALADRRKEPSPRRERERVTWTILVADGDGPYAEYPDAVPVERFVADLKARYGPGVDTAALAAQAEEAAAAHPGFKVYVTNVKIEAA